MSKDYVKTGTTCIGLKYKDGVMLAADNRVTTYKIEGDSFTKLFNLSKNVVSTVAGSVSDAQLFMRHLQSEIRLIELKKERQIRVKEAAMILNSIQYNMVRSSGSIVSSIMGGYDSKLGPQIFELAPDGSLLDHESYYTTGSGSIFVKSILDAGYKENLSEKEAAELVKQGFKASFKNDTASGGGYIIRTITKDGIKEIEKKMTQMEIVDRK